MEFEKAFTQEKIEVTDRIKTGKTKFVKTRGEAQKLTKYVGYFYPLFSTNCNKAEVIGYGIPK